MKKSLNIVLTIFTILIGLQTHAQVQRMNRAKIGGSTPIENSSILELESSTQGILIPRMTSLERENILSPANSLIIFNTTNNNLEIYKSACACWVTVTDNAPAVSVENSAPTASNLSYNGNFLNGQTVTLSYVYTDAQNDPEGLTTIQWQRATSSAGADLTNIAGANTASYTITAGDEGQWIRVVITPRASSGVLNGIASYLPFIYVDPATAPYATGVSLSGTIAQGSIITGNYTFAGGSGVESTDPASLSLFNWQTAIDTNGTGATNATNYSGTPYGTTYIPQSDLLGRYIRFGVRPRDDNNAISTNFIHSEWQGPIVAATEQVPVASNVTYSPDPGANLPLLGNYTFLDANGDPESGTTFQWYTASDASGTSQAAIGGATNLTYTPTPANGGSYIGFGVTPKAATGNTASGTEVIYYSSNPTVDAATFSFTGNFSYLPLFNAGRVMNSDNRLLVEINVTSAGGIVFSSNTVNGYSFALSQVFNTIGVQWVTLNATGVLTTYNASGDNFTITGLGTTSITQAVTIKNTLTGASATSPHGSNADAFSTNSNCADKLISAGYTSGTCSGSVTSGSNTYDLVLINGQCWMQSNSREASSAPCADAINTGCNVYTSPVPSSFATWGYYNTADVSGLSGWATSPPAAGEGLLYQWNAAMNGSTTERAQGVCPTGFHVPSDCEFMYLEHGLGMTVAEQITEANRASGAVGAQLNDVSVPGATNSSGFTMLRQGRRHNSQFQSRNSNEQLWTSTLKSTAEAFRRNNISNGNFAIGSGFQRAPDVRGMSSAVRCIKD